MENPRGHISSLHYQYKARALKKGLAFGISREEFEELILSDCYICGAKPAGRMRKRQKLLKYNGIDRIDNTQGYVHGNVAPCCGLCNRVKSDLKACDLKKHLKLMLKGLGRVA